MIPDLLCLSAKLPEHRYLVQKFDCEEVELRSLRESSTDGLQLTTNLASGYDVGDRALSEFYCGDPIEISVISRSSMRRGERVILVLVLHSEEPKSEDTAVFAEYQAESSGRSLAGHRRTRRSQSSDDFDEIVDEMEGFVKGNHADVDETADMLDLSSGGDQDYVVDSDLDEDLEKVIKQTSSKGSSRSKSARSSSDKGKKGKASKAATPKRGPGSAKKVSLVLSLSPSLPPLFLSCVFFFICIHFVSVLFC